MIGNHGGLLREIPSRFLQEIAHTLARITCDNYKDGREGNNARHPGMNVNSLDRGNHSGLGREDSPTMLRIMVMDIKSP